MPERKHAMKTTNLHPPGSLAALAAEGRACIDRDQREFDAEDGIVAPEPPDDELARQRVKERKMGTTDALDVITARGIITDTVTCLEEFAGRLASGEKHPFSADFLRDAADKLDELLG
jgi:hypothetical protein